MIGPVNLAPSGNLYTDSSALEQLVMPVMHMRLLSSRGFLQLPRASQLHQGQSRAILTSMLILSIGDRTMEVFNGAVGRYQLWAYNGED